MVPLTDNLLQLAPRLRLIHQWGVGLEGVDVESATRRGIHVCRVPGEISHNAISTAEHAVFLVLSLLKKAPQLTRSVRHGVLGAPATEALLGKRVLLLGYGHLGQALAPRLAAFGCHLAAVKVRPTWDPATIAPLEETALLHQPEAHRLIGEADIIVLCCMLTSTNVGMINAGFLGNVKPGVRIVNVARGPLLDYAAVTAALDSGRIGGLAMDVFWSEPIDPQDPLLQRPNVVATPHVGGHSDLSQVSIGAVLEENVRRLRAGLPLAHAVNRPAPARAA
eukprot:EG_transcript_15937